MVGVEAGKGGRRSWIKDIHSLGPFETKISVQVHSPDYNINDHDDCCGGYDDDGNDCVYNLKPKFRLRSTPLLGMLMSDDNDDADGDDDYIGDYDMEEDDGNDDDDDDDDNSD